MKDNRDGRLAPISVGQIASNFLLPQTQQTSVALQSYAGSSVVLAFYPMDWEPVSREQLGLYQDYIAEFDRLGAYLLGISTDHVLSHEAFARDAGIQFPLLADFQPRGAVAQRYGVYRGVPGISARALFVLDSQRAVCFSQVYPDPLNPGVDDLLNILEMLAQEPPPDSAS